MLLEVCSGHTSSQASEPLLRPLFNMDVTPAGYSLSHCENYFSIKMQKLELCPGRQLKILLSGGTYHRGLSGHLPHPAASRNAPQVQGPSCKHLIQCLRVTLPLSETSSIGYHAYFTDEQTEVPVPHLQNHPGSECLQPQPQGRKIIPHMQPVLYSGQCLLTHCLVQLSDPVKQELESPPLCRWSLA